jgi:hypothetical protein
MFRRGIQSCRIEETDLISRWNWTILTTAMADTKSPDKHSINGLRETFASEFSFDSKATRIYEVYRESVDIYQRAQIALGRIPQYKITAGSTNQRFYINAR